jgi:hypothetical protein
MHIRPTAGKRFLLLLPSDLQGSCCFFLLTYKVPVVASFLFISFLLLLHSDLQGPCSFRLVYKVPVSLFCFTQGSLCCFLLIYKVSVAASF